MELEYICNHIIRTTHTPIRYYINESEWVLQHYYGNNANNDPVLCDKEFEKMMIATANENYPVIYMEKYPLYYSVIQHKTQLFIIGPVSTERHQMCSDGTTVNAYTKNTHKISHVFRVSYCGYDLFCEELLLLFYTLTGKTVSYQELNEKNYMNQNLLDDMNKNISELFFYYHELEKTHNPYDREVREMESIRHGDVDSLIQSMDETFIGEYAVLSKNTLRASKNLAIVGLAISARAAIEGGGFPLKNPFP